MEHALEQPETRVSDEGANLIEETSLRVGPDGGRPGARVR